MADTEAKPFTAQFMPAMRTITKTVEVSTAEVHLDAKQVDDIVRNWVVANASMAIGEYLAFDEVEVSASVSFHGDFHGYDVTITKELKTDG